MLDPLNSNERVWLLTAIAGGIAWVFKVAIPKVFGMTKSRVQNLEDENDRLKSALRSALSAIEVLLVAMELPEGGRHRHVDRAKKLVEEARELWVS